MPPALLFKDKIEESDLLSLIGTTSEGEYFDFKKDAYIKQNDKWRLDLCTDVSAFANANGGLIICGMTAKNGVADDICGLGANTDLDAERLRLRQVVDNGISPQIPGLRFQDVILSDPNKAVALVIQIPRSFTAPHRIEHSKQFKIRRSNGNDDMSVDELRRAFTSSSMLIENVRGFRRERINALAENKQEEIPIVLSSGPTVVLHFIPLAFSNSGSYVDLSVFHLRGQQPSWVSKYYLTYGRFNLDGFVRPNGYANPNTALAGYVQIYRTGVIECVDVIRTQQESGKTVRLLAIEDIILKYTDMAWAIQQNLEIETPIILLVSLIGMKDYILDVDDPFAFEDYPEVPLRSNRILLPDILINDYRVDQKSILKPVFDIVWNAAGLEQSTSYNLDGNWIRNSRR